MNIPNFQDSQVIDPKTGKWTDEWKQIMQALFQSLQNSAGNEGLVAPGQTTANIATIQTNAPNGAIIYDSTTNEFKGNMNGTFRVFLT
jgi:hypothetical protein